jgi:hypothetical protein
MNELLSNEQPPLCRTCRAPMTSRMGPYGLFWACRASYPGNNHGTQSYRPNSHGYRGSQMQEEDRSEMQRYATGEDDGYESNQLVKARIHLWENTNPYVTTMRDIDAIAAVVHASDENFPYPF